MINNLENPVNKNLINEELNKVRLPYSKNIHSNLNFMQSLKLNHTFEKKNKDKQKFLENLQREAIFA